MNERRRKCIFLGATDLMQYLVVAFTLYCFNPLRRYVEASSCFLNKAELSMRIKFTCVDRPCYGKATSQP